MHSTLAASLSALALLALVSSPLHAQAGPGTARQLAAKLDPYVDCLNEHGNWTNGSRDRYLSWVKSAEKGPTGREMVVYGLYQLRDSARCAAGVARASALPPDMPELEAKAAAFTQALANAKRVTDEAHDYYDMEDYKDDSMKRGKAMHAGVMQAFASFAEANDRLHAQVVAEKNELARADLERLRADPAHERDYLAGMMLFTAREVADLGAVRADDLDLPAYEAKLSEYDASYRAAAGLKPGAGSEPIPSIVMDAARDFLKSAKDYLRRARGGFRYEDHESIFLENNPEMIEGHPAKLIADYNKLVGWANSRM